ncbi:hypothetical protein HJG60_009854 [Phyllostomus discolor]|uniref:Endonuclease/exonuclease/phosphatase domain-containing protein n=1 Tax=Phyllostomus discolor TaxID=89673 RepID=A0A834ELF2_9CHIR|nr:hypothetical protein HJG60_009854 [Phyllostomus discolor]
MLPTRDPPQNQRPIQTESERLEKIFQANGHEKRAGVEIIISDRIDFRTTTIREDREGYFIILKGRVHQEDITIINIYAPNIGAPKYIRKILEDFKKDTDCETLITGDFNAPLSTMDRSPKQRINKDIMALNDTLDQMDLIDMYRMFHPREAKYIFFSNAQRTFSKTDHRVGCKGSLKKFKKIEIIQALSWITMA